MPVAGSRHYQGPGLGEAMWKCPSCGAENQGPIAAGCTLCGAGTPDQKSEAPPPPPPDLEPEGEEQLGPFDRWALAHPQATLEDAFTAGYVEGMRDMQRQQQRAVPQAQTFLAEGKATRTIVAALMVFRDQVLATEPEEIATGEWMSVAEVTQLIRHFSQQQG